MKIELYVDGSEIGKRKEKLEFKIMLRLNSVTFSSLVSFINRKIVTREFACITLWRLFSTTYTIPVRITRRQINTLGQHWVLSLKDLWKSIITIKLIFHSLCLSLFFRLTFSCPKATILFAIHLQKLYILLKQAGFPGFS